MIYHKHDETMHLFLVFTTQRVYFLITFMVLFATDFHFFLWKSSLLELLFLERFLRTYINVAPFEEEMASVGATRFIVVNPVASPLS